jgi:hypothetical protein
LLDRVYSRTTAAYRAQVHAPLFTHPQSETQQHQSQQVQQHHNCNVSNQVSTIGELTDDNALRTFQPFQSSPTSVVGRLPDCAPQTPYAVSEEDAQIQTLHRMTDESQLSTSANVNRSGEPQDLEVVEYFDKLNSVSILGEVLGHSQRRRLVQLDLPGHEYKSAQEREVAALDSADRAYLNSQGVFRKPSKTSWFVQQYSWMLSRLMIRK